MSESLTRDQIYARFLEWRGIDPRDACRECEGSGRKVYGSTALWRPGIGGAAMTPGPCDACWGSGDISHPGVDLRRRELLEKERNALLASCGWLAGVVIRDQAGTPDPDGWINKGKGFYREALDRAENFEIMLRRVVNRMKKSSDAGLRPLADTAADLLARKGVSSPLREGVPDGQD
jgi:hypothetical protein